MIDWSFPGVLPVLNKGVVDAGIKAALALNMDCLLYTSTGMMPSKGSQQSFTTPLIINHGPLNVSIVFVNYGGFIMPSLGR